MCKAIATLFYKFVFFGIEIVTGMGNQGNYGDAPGKEGLKSWDKDICILQQKTMTVNSG